MAVRLTFGLILFFSLFLKTASADEIAINPSHPDQYRVVRGDTLWDIAGRFLQHPAQWPLIWEVNPQIQNPHLIYPGDLITFSIVNGQPQLSLTRGDNDYNSNSAELPDDGKLHPRIRELNIKEAIELIPSHKISQFLSSPRIVGPTELAAAPYVVDFVGEHLIAGAGDRVYVRAITKPESLSYTVYRTGNTFISPETGQILGYEAKYIANSSLQSPGDPATLYIRESKSEIQTGDRIMPQEDDKFTLNYFPQPPESEITGSIISVLDGVTQVGRYSVVAIDKGEVDGLKIGHVLDIYRNGRAVRDPYSTEQNVPVKLPDELAGSLMIFRTFERVSYALVMEANQAIHVLDKIKTP